MLEFKANPCYVKVLKLESIMNKTYNSSHSRTSRDKGGHDSSVPVILYNDKSEIALIIQDNAPVWRVFGNGFNPLDDNKGQYDIYRRHVSKVLKLETNLPQKLLSKAEPLLYFKTTDSEGNILENHRVFAIDIGNFPLESKKGAFIDFFPMDQRPKNMYALHGEIFDLAVKQLLKHKQLSHRPQVQDVSGMLLLDQMLEDGEDIIGLQQWKTHPAVEARRKDGTLSRDPAPSG